MGWKAANVYAKERMNFTTENTKEKIFTHKVQPYYSLRCIPQILGPVYDELLNAEKY